MTDLRQQITEALDEAERVAVQASYGMSLTRASEWRAEFADEPDPDGGWRKRWAVLGGTQLVARCPEVSPRFSAFIARWDPARVLRLVERDRRDLADACQVLDGDRAVHVQAVWLAGRALERMVAFWLGSPEGS